MSARSSGRSAAQLAGVFAALGDATRLELVQRLNDARPRSISKLADGLSLTRQGVTKHLRVLEGAGVVQSSTVGREHRFTLVLESVDAVRTYLDGVSAQWDEALERLRRFVEKERE